MKLIIPIILPLILLVSSCQEIRQEISINNPVSPTSQSQQSAKVLAENASFKDKEITVNITIIHNPKLAFSYQDCQAVSSLSERELLLQKAQKENIEVSDAQVKELVNDLLVQSGMTWQEWEQQLVNSGQIPDAILEEYKFNMIISELLNKKVYSQIQISETEIANYYQNHIDDFSLIRASHILLDNEEDGRMVVSLIQNGGDFAQLAKEYSIDQYSASEGGDLEYFTRTQMVPQFSDVAFNLEVGQVSNIVKTNYGYHIIKVVAKKKVPFSEAKEQIKPALLRAKEFTGANTYLQQLKKEVTS